MYVLLSILDRVVSYNASDDEQEFDGYANICVRINIESHESTDEWNDQQFDDPIDNDYSHHDFVYQCIV